MPASPAMRRWLPGARLGRYELVARVATGGMGEVWAARVHGSAGFQKLFAVKMLRAELADDARFERMFVAEAELASRLVHPNVVRVVDLGEDDGSLYQVMEWVTGVSLWTLARSSAGRQVPLAVAARIVWQVCAGLHAAHELRGDDGEPLGLVHRDVSPQNVMVSSGGVAMLLDFGVARVGRRATGEAAEVTAAGELKGKVPYVAPEQALGLPTDRRADVFAAGVMLYELVAGSHPFLADDDRVTLARIASAAPAPPLRARWPAAPAELERVLAAALAKSPERRLQSAAELARSIAHAAPAAALQSTDDRVGCHVREVAGAQIDRSAADLRAALARAGGAAPAATSRPTRADEEETLGAATVTPGAMPPRRARVLQGAAIAATLAALLALAAVWRRSSTAPPAPPAPAASERRDSSPPGDVVPAAEARAEAGEGSPAAITATDPPAPSAPPASEPPPAPAPPLPGPAWPRKKQREFTPGGL